MSVPFQQLSVQALRLLLILTCSIPLSLALDSDSYRVSLGLIGHTQTNEVRLSLAILAGATLGVIAACSLLAREVERSFKILAALANALGHGQTIDIPGLRLREAERVASALRQADTQLRALAAERDQAIRLNAQLQDRADRLAYAVNHDALTGLSNRARFYAALQRHIDARRGTRDTVVVFFIDVDDFKTINDTRGHGAGDEVLRIFARRLRESVRDTDLVARLGGDEFAVLLTSTDSDKAQSLARDLTERLSQPYEIEGEQVLVSASIGVAKAEENESSAKELLEAADAAMYRAKEGGKRRFIVSDQGADPRLH